VESQIQVHDVFGRGGLSSAQRPFHHSTHNSGTTTASFLITLQQSSVINKVMTLLIREFFFKNKHDRKKALSLRHHQSNTSAFRFFLLYIDLTT